MPRRTRIVIPDVPHHMTQRGDDRTVYRELLMLASSVSSCPFAPFDGRCRADAPPA